MKKVTRITFKVPEIPGGYRDSNDSTPCIHRYLNKWEGEYICMDCWKKLEAPPCCSFQCFFVFACPSSLDFTDISGLSDFQRIKLENTLESCTPRDPTPCFLFDNEARAKNIGKMSQRRGISIGFLLAFTEKYNCWTWSSWEIIRKIIKPSTEKQRCRYVELESMQEYVGPAATFISYAQKGVWGDLVAAVLDGGADLNRKVWIDIFAVRQWPSDTPDLDFASTIEHCESFLCVCSYVPSIEKLEWWQCTPHNIHLIPVVERQQIAFLRVWCLVEIAAAARMGPEKLPVIMKCGSHSLRFKNSTDAESLPSPTTTQWDCDLPSPTTTQWDCDPAYVRFRSKDELLQKLSLLIDIHKAEATVASDKMRILSEIQGSLTIDFLNSVVKGILRGAQALGWCGELGKVIQCAACGDQGAIEIMLSRASESMLPVCAGGYVRLLDLLLDVNADVNFATKFEYTPLMYAAQGGHIACVLKLISRIDANIIDKENNDGRTALTIAAWGGHDNCVEILISHGANVNFLGINGDTPLGCACDGGHFHCVKKLIEKGAVDLKESNWPAIFWATQKGHIDCVRLLLDNGTDANTLDKSLWTPLMYAAQGGFDGIIEMLITRGANVNLLNEEGETALIRAACHGHENAMKILLLHQADPHLYTVVGTALICAAKEGQHDCVALLLTYGVDVNIKDKDGYTALAIAVKEGKNECVEILNAYSQKLLV